MAEQHDRILGYFLEEAVEHLNTIEQGLRKLPETVRQPTMIRELFRAAHSIKGSAAMLGLLDIQKIGNQFEANFKLLKENPQIAADKQLQSLFLESFSFLRAGINEVSESSDPYRQDPATPDSIGDPVFEELKSYLQHLLATANPAPVTTAIGFQNPGRDPSVYQVFGEYVTRKLDEIISLCSQLDRPEVRTQIQQICQKLGNLGENFELLEWTNLFTACRLAIANPANPLSQLGESISTNVKQAQLLILADRHQEIAISPELGALIGHHNRPAPSNDPFVAIHDPVEYIEPSTWKLDDATDPFARIEIANEDTTQKFPNLSSINGDIAAPLIFDTSDPVSPSAEIDSDTMELNEFMNLLSDDLPTEGAWIQDDDFFDRQVPLQDLGDVTTDKFEQQMLEPVSQFTTDLATAIGQVNAGANEPPDNTVDYDEETFYTPDLGDIDDRDLANFWLDTELAALPPQSLQPDLDLLDRLDLQLQPDLFSALDLVDISGPQFSLDRPMSDLFLNVTAAKDLSKLDDSAAISSDEMVAPVASIADAEIINTADELDLPGLPSLTESVSEFGLTQTEPIQSSKVEVVSTLDCQIESSDLPPDLQIPAILEEDLDLSFEGLQPQPEPIAPIDFQHQNHDRDSLPETLRERSADSIDSSVSEVLFLEELGSKLSESSDLFFLEDLDGGNLSESRIEDSRTTTELANWFDNSTSQGIVDTIEQDQDDNFEDLDLDILNYGEPEVDLAVNNNFSDLDLDPNSELNKSIDHRFGNLDLDIFGGSEPITDLAISDRSLGLDLNCNHSDPGSFTHNDSTDIDLNSDSNNFTNLELNVRGLGDLDLNSSLSNDFEDLDLGTIDRSTPGSDLDIFGDFSPVDNADLIGLDLHLPDLEAASPLEDRQLTVNTSASHDFTGLEPLDLNNDDLDILDRAESVVEPSINHDFADLDLDILNAESSVINESQSSTFENFSGLDFNLDELSVNLDSHELTNLESMLGQPESNLAEGGDLDALLGITALGVGASAILTGEESAFDDLDALMTGAGQTTDPATSLDDLDCLLLTPEPVVNPPATTPNSAEPTQPAPVSGLSTGDRKSTGRAKQSRTFEQTMRVSVRHLDNLNNLVGELVVNRNTLEQDQNRMRQFVEKLLSEVQKLNEVGKRMQDLYERSLMENSLVASRQQSKPTTNPQVSSEDLAVTGTLIEYDPLEMDRFTPIHLLSQKMIELTVRVRESTADIEFVVDGSTEVTRTLRQITGQLQEDLTKSRMLPFAQTADRLQRGVRDNGLKYGKQIELSVEGRDTLIDKVILESLAEPLMHMANNAIAHGIESTEARLAVGKQIEGQITIRALHQGNQTIISISDDGAGINTERVKAKAIEKGIITAQQAVTMSKTEIYELLFLPSFSTKDEADELSGRGVGMDVVRTSITEIRGTITTESQLGVGTTFTIRLPLALSIAKALIAVNNKSNIAFPMDGIEDTQDVSPEQIQTNSEGEQCIFWRDELMPFKPLSDLLGFNRPLARNNFYTTNEDDSDLVSILILRSDGNLIAVQVDKIAGDQEIVIKPLQGPASKPLGIAGATVMGDGRIIPIADVMELISLANGTLSRQISTQWTAQMTTPAIEARESMVLIVDDSITVRELLSLTFKRAGYRVEQARDGQEAWDKLRAGLPCDIVFCDIEMPRMDGLEFLSRIQKDVALSKVPVAMLTSRGSDRHRQIASQLGASGYFIKPYLEEALLDAAKRMIKGEVLEIV